MTTATLPAPATAPAPIPAPPAWGSSLGSHDTYDGAVAAWGARAIWVRPDYSARKGSPASRPGLDLLGDRQDVTVVDEALRLTLREAIDAGVQAIRAGVAAWDYDERSSGVRVLPEVVAGGYRVAPRYGVSYGYVYCLVVVRPLTDAERAQAEAERAEAERAEQAKRDKRTTKARITRAVRKHTAFGSFEDLLDTHPDYWPTMRVSEHPDLLVLADAFDAACEARGQSRRAWRR
jgi:hypothetical protein